MSGAMGAAGKAAAGAQYPDCDFNGIWAAHQISQAKVLELPQAVNVWIYLEIQQTGSDITVAKSFECGVEVQGTITATLSRETLIAATKINNQRGRKGQVSKQGNSCGLQIARYWTIRGADELRFIPNPERDSSQSITDVRAVNPLPTPQKPDGAVDSENDGKLGIASQITGIVSGTRNSVQREWTRYFTDSGYEIVPSLDWSNDLTIRAEYDNEDSVMDPISGLLTTVPQADLTAKHLLKLRFLGRDKSDPRATAFLKPADVDTCYAIQDAMPVESLQ